MESFSTQTENHIDRYVMDGDAARSPKFPGSESLVSTRRDP